MNSCDTSVNAAAIKSDVDWLEYIIRKQVSASFKVSSKFEKVEQFDFYRSAPAPEANTLSPYHNFISQNELADEDRLLLTLALVPHVYPHFLDQHLAAKVNEVRPESRSFIIGGAPGAFFRGFTPTGLTWLFLVAGSEIALRLKALSHLTRRSKLCAHGTITFSGAKDNEPLFSGAILIDHETLNELLGIQNSTDSKYYESIHQTN